MPPNLVDADNHSVDNMIKASSPKASIYELRSSISVLSGDGSTDHLNNILTADVSKLNNGERVDALVCDSNGRVKDVLSCFGIDGEIIILGIYENMEDTRSLITAGIPWNKNLVLYDAKDALRHCVIHGEDALELVRLLYPEVSDVPDQTFVPIGDVIVSKNSVSDGGHIDILYRSDDDSIERRILEKSIGIGTSDEWEAVRIRSRLPSAKEVDGTRLPSDIGLGKLVSLNKGCYPGQEIHARLDSRGSEKKHMITITSHQPIVLGKTKLEGGLTMEVTSATEYDGGHVALAVAPKEINKGAVFTLTGLEYKIG